MKTIRRKQIDQAGIVHETITYTGEGGGEITFQTGNTRPIVTPGPVPEHVADFEKLNTGETGRNGTRWKAHWENYGQELATRDEGARCLPIDYQPPHHKALGLRDHKEATAARMMEALHQGDADYFKGLAKALIAYAAPGGNVRHLDHGDIHAARKNGVEAIREAAAAAGGVPTVEAINGCYATASCTNKDFRKQVLIPLGFGWIKNAPRGNPQMG